MKQNPSQTRSPFFWFNFTFQLTRQIFLFFFALFFHLIKQKFWFKILLLKSAIKNKNKNKKKKLLIWRNLFSLHKRFYGVTVSTLDFESSNPSSNLGRTSLKYFFRRFFFWFKRFKRDLSSYFAIEPLSNYRSEIFDCVEIEFGNLGKKMPIWKIIKRPRTPGIPRRSPIQVLTGLDVA